MALLFIFTEEKISFRAEKVVFFENEQENGNVLIKLHYTASHWRKKDATEILSHTQFTSFTAFSL